MRFIRRFLLCLALTIALAAIFVAVAFIPAVQTLVAQHKLDEHPRFHAVLGSLSAGVNDLDAHDLNLEVNGALLTLPALQAQLPVATAIWDRKLQVRSLVAKGWTLDLNGPPETKPPPTPTPPALAPGPPTASPPPAPNTSAPAIAALNTALVFHQILTGWELPRDASIDAVDLEGDVLLPAPRGTDPIAVHLGIKGGGMGAGREGTFAIDATFPLVGDDGYLLAMLTAHGRLVVATDASRVPSRVELTAGLTTIKGHALPDGISVFATLIAADGTHDESYTVGFNRGERHAATVVAHSSKTTRQFAGTWKVDLRESDLTTFFPKRTLPPIAATGAGDFETDAAFTRVRATGHLTAVSSHLDVLAPMLERLGPVTLNTDFDVSHSAQSLRFDRLNASLGGARPAIAVRSLQPFTLDEQTGDLHVADAHTDWLDGSLPGFPLVWIFGSPDGLGVGGTDVTGEFIVHSSDGEIAVRSKTPLTALGLTVQNEEKILARGLDVSGSLLAKISAQDWQVQAAPLTIESAGQRVATVEATASRPSEGDHPIKITGTWSADPMALAAQPWLAAFGGTTGRSASGEFSVLAGSRLNVENKFTLVGHDPTHSLTASLKVGTDYDGRYTFYAPVKIALGPSASEISVEGSWARAAAGGRTVLNLSGDNVTLEHLMLLAAPFAGAPLTAVANTRDQTPFWGDWVGRVGLDFALLKAWGHNFADVGGTFFVDHSSIKLEGGRGAMHQDRRVRAEGTVTFDAAAEVPYAAKASAAMDEIEGAVLFGPPPRGHEPLLRGRFAIAGTLTGGGLNLADLANHTQEEFHLTSTVGSTRLLQTSVADSITEAPTPVADALGTVGSVFGTLLGTKRNILQSEKNPLSKNTDAVLNFTYMIHEIRYDRIALTAIRGSDRAIRLVDVEIVTPDERLTGSGQLAAVSGKPLGAWPLSLEFKLGVRGHAAEFLTEAGLLSAQKDDQGYTLLKQPVRFGGTVEQIDQGEWHDLLTKAAAPPKPEREKKKN